MKNKDPLDQSAQFVKGVGPKKIKVLNRLGIKTVEDLLYYFPFRYEDRSHFKNISQLEVGKYQTVKAEVLACGLRRIRRAKAIFEMAVGDSLGKLFTVWFNQPYMKDYFKVGDEVILYGKVERKKRLQIINPEYELISGNKQEKSIHTGRIVPIYRLVKGINQRFLRKIIYECVVSFSSLARDNLPSFIRQKHYLLHLTASLRNIHFPQNKLLFERARRRLIFEEFFNFQLVMALRRMKAKTDLKGISFKLKGNLISDFNKNLPFNLTPSQKEVIRHIQDDMKDPRPMQRLLQGDVGSGKTIVATYSILLAVENGYQAALMAPTEILAEQHYLTLNQLLRGLDVNIVLLSSGTKDKDKDMIKKQIENQEADIVIGTHALIQEDIRFKKLGLVVIDEQHKFGVIQRNTLKEKGVHPDVLVMTATPIPRTLAYTIYGDLDFSIIKELPPGRKPVTTWWVTEKKREGAYDFVRKQIKAGRQAYIVYPLVEESSKLELRAAKNMYKNLKDKVFSGFKVGLVHGQMKSQDKEQVMKDFKKGEINILVSTIIIEVGIDIPNASCLLIEHAERFGLSQLHQLRGRIGRGKYQSYCILTSSSHSQTAKKRLSSISKCNDGFKIAEEDLRLRGPGQFFGTRQHGYPELRIGNILTDIKLLETARCEGFDLVQKDPQLTKSQNRNLLDQICQYL